MTGTAGSSLSLQCWYERAYEGYNKYWCRGPYDTDCHKIVETKGGEEEERNGRVSIRDSADDLTITVTIENLSEDDVGSYWCKIQTIWIFDEWSRDPSFQVEVYVNPGNHCPGSSNGAYGVWRGLGTRGGGVSESCPQSQGRGQGEGWLTLQPRAEPLPPRSLSSSWGP